MLCLCQPSRQPANTRVLGIHCGQTSFSRQKLRSIKRTKSYSIYDSFEEAVFCPYLNTFIKNITLKKKDDVVWLALLQRTEQHMPQFESAQPLNATHK